VKPTPKPAPVPESESESESEIESEPVKGTVPLKPTWPTMEKPKMFKTPITPPKLPMVGPLSEADLRGYGRWKETQSIKLSQLNEASKTAFREINDLVKQISRISPPIKEWVNEQCPMEDGSRRSHRLVRICQQSAKHGHNLRAAIINHLESQKAKCAVALTDTEGDKALKDDQKLVLERGIKNAKNFELAEYERIASGLIQKEGELKENSRQHFAISEELERMRDLVNAMAKVKEDALAAFQLLKTAYPAQFTGVSDLSNLDPTRMVLPVEAAPDRKSALDAIKKYCSAKALYDLAYDQIHHDPWKKWVFSS